MPIGSSGTSNSWSEPLKYVSSCSTYGLELEQRRLPRGVGLGRGVGRDHALEALAVHELDVAQALGRAGDEQQPDRRGHDVVGEPHGREDSGGVSRVPAPVRESSAGSNRARQERAGALAGSARHVLAEVRARAAPPRAGRGPRAGAASRAAADQAERAAEREHRAERGEQRPEVAGVPHAARRARRSRARARAAPPRRGEKRAPSRAIAAIRRASPARREHHAAPSAARAPPGSGHHPSRSPERGDRRRQQRDHEQREHRQRGIAARPRPRPARAPGAAARASTRADAADREQRERAGGARAAAPTPPSASASSAASSAVASSASAAISGGRPTAAPARRVAAGRAQLRAPRPGPARALPSRMVTRCPGKKSCGQDRVAPHAVAPQLASSRARPTSPAPCRAPPGRPSRSAP